VSTSGSVVVVAEEVAVRGADVVGVDVVVSRRVLETVVSRRVVETAFSGEVVDAALSELPPHPAGPSTRTEARSRTAVAIVVASSREVLMAASSPSPEVDR